MAGWGTPTSNDQNARYVFVLQHTNGEVLILSASSATPNPVTADVAFAAAATLLDASPDFVVTTAIKQYPTRVTYTP